MGFEYGYGGEFRDPNSPNLDNGILKANAKFGATEQRNVLGIIDIRVDDLLIAGGDFFYRIHFRENVRKSEVDSYGGTKRPIWA